MNRISENSKNSMSKGPVAGVNTFWKQKVDVAWVWSTEGGNRERLRGGWV